jgi:hypothetical protein
LVVLQNPPDLEKVRGLHSEICPASSHDAYPAVRIKAEVLSDAEEEEYPVPLTFVEIKAEPEVSCGSVRLISQIQVSLIIRTLIQRTIYIHKRFLFVKAEKCIHSMVQVGRSKHHLPASPIIPVSVHMPCSDHTESSVLLMLIFCP